MSASKSRLVSGAAHLFDKDEFSDLRIKCEDLQISAHKLVVCTPSDVLYAMCTAGFRESESNTIDLSDDTKDVVYRMIDFLYRGDYEIDEDSGEEHHAILHAAMFAVADKYNISALGDAAKDKFEESIKGIFEVFPDIDSFMDVVEYVYNTTPESNRGLRDLVVRQTQTHGANIMADPALSSRLEVIISAIPSFAMDLIQKSFLQASPKRCSACNEYLGDRASCTANNCVFHGGQGGNTQATITGIYSGNPMRDTHARPGLFYENPMRATFTNAFGMPTSDNHAANDPSDFDSN